jgi:hypothetical protein
MKTLKVKIDKTGTKVTVDADGFVGSSCEAATKPYLDALGISMDDVKQETKPEFVMAEGEQSVDQG